MPANAVIISVVTVNAWSISVCVQSETGPCSQFVPVEAVTAATSTVCPCRIRVPSEAAASSAVFPHSRPVHVSGIALDTFSPLQGGKSATIPCLPTRHGRGHSTDNPHSLGFHLDPPPGSGFTRGESLRG